MSRIRGSFAAKLVAFELGTIILVSVLLAVLLVSARLLQTRDLERNVARVASEALARDISNAGTGSVSLAQRLAAFAPLRDDVARRDRARVDQLLGGEVQILPVHESLVVLDAAGRGFAAAANGSAPDPARWNQLPVAQFAGSAPEGRIVNFGGTLELDSLSPILVGGHPIGYVLDSIDLQGLLRQLVPSGSGVQYSIFFDRVRRASTFGAGQVGGPLPAGVDASANSFGVYDIDGATYAGYYAALPAQAGDRVLIAADVADAVFAAQRLNDALVIFFATAVLATIFSLLAVLFARRYALAPLAALNSGAARLGSGDYSSTVDVDSHDDFGRLADGFNLMAEKIRENTTELEQQRGRLNAALSSLSAVSRALTTTTAGEAALRDAVTGAVAEITGADAVAMLVGAERPAVSAVRGMPIAQARRAATSPELAAALRPGGAVFQFDPGGTLLPGWSGVAVPMIYQDRTLGALVAMSERPMDAVDLPALTVLANQATVALQNSELFDRERETVRRLQELDSMKSDFLATIQHELRTPLTAIIGMTDLMEMAWNSWGDPQKLDALTDVQLAAKGLYDIVETVLDYSMLESDRIRIQASPVLIGDAAAVAVDELHAQVARRKVDIDVKVPPALVANGDARRLSQVARALIENAVKFSAEGGTVKIRGGREDGMVYLRVSDRGIGIDKDDQKRIFERFFQVDNTATRAYGGTGMGLALAEKLVELHGGRIAVESAPGKGSTFTVFLPAVGEQASNGRAPRRSRAAR